MADDLSATTSPLPCASGSLRPATHVQFAEQWVLPPYCTQLGSLLYSETMQRMVPLLRTSLLEDVSKQQSSMPREDAGAEARNPRP